MAYRTKPAWMLGTAIVAHLLFFALALVVPPKVDSDASEGMRVWRSHEAGARWNCTIDPDPSNIALDRENFLSWWSPGQYLVVGPLHSLGLSWGASIAAATFVCSVAGIAGYTWLFLRLGFGLETSAGASAALSLAWNVTRAYGEYPGGEVPIFAVSPWLVGLILALRPLKAWSAAPFAAIYLIGALTKLSFCVTAAAALVGVCCLEIAARPSVRLALGIAAKAAFMLAVGHLFLWLVFLRHGANPSSIGPSGRPWWYAFPTLVSLSLGSPFGLGSMLGRLLLFPGHPLVASPVAMAPIFWICSAASCVFLAKLARLKVLSADYRVWAGALAAVFVSVLGVLITSGAPISLEDRQMFPVGAIIFPAVVVLARTAAEPLWRIAAAALLTCGIAYGVTAVGVHAHQLSRVANVGRAGFTQHIITPEALGVLHELDDRLGIRADASLIYVPSPEISFEVSHARVLSTYDLSLSADELRLRTRHGKVPFLAVLSNSVLADGGRDRVVMSSFVDYDPSKWQSRRAGDWTFYYQGRWPQN